MESAKETERKRWRPFVPPRRRRAHLVDRSDKLSGVEWTPRRRGESIHPVHHARFPSHTLVRSPHVSFQRPVTASGALSSRSLPWLAPTRMQLTVPDLRASSAELLRSHLFRTQVTPICYGRRFHREETGNLAFRLVNVVNCERWKFLRLSFGIELLMLNCVHSDTVGCRLRSLAPRAV